MQTEVEHIHHWYIGDTTGLAASSNFFTSPTQDTLLALDHLYRQPGVNTFI